MLCALATNPTSLDSLKSQDYLRTLLGWDKVDQLKGLKEAIDRHPNVLPPKRTVTSRANTTHAPPFRANLEDSDLLDFLQIYSGERKSLAIRVPNDENELLSIEISREMCQNLIEYAMEKTRRRMISEQIQVQDSVQGEK